MIGLVRNEWKKVFLPVLLTTVLLAIAMGVLSCTIYQNYVLHYDLEAWEVGTELFSLLYPLFVVVPLCWNLYYERKNNFLLYVMPRVKIKKYLTAKWIAYALGTLCIIVIPYILSAVFALYVKPPVVPFVENPFSHIFENAFIKTPLLYAVALSLWRGIVSLFVPLGNEWNLAAGATEAELFSTLEQLFASPLQAFVCFTLYQLIGSWLIFGICMWIGHFTERKWTIRIVIVLYVLSAVWIKLPAIQNIPLTSFNHLLILHHNFGEPARPWITGFTLLLFMLTIMFSVRFAWRGHLPQLRLKCHGIAAYYSYELMTKRNILTQPDAHSYFLLDGSFPHFYYLTNDRYGEAILRLLCDTQQRRTLDAILADGLHEGIPNWRVENDAIDSEGNPVLFAYTCDFPRIRRFDTALELHGMTGTLICFDYQEEALREICGQCVMLQSIDFQQFERSVLYS